MYLNYFGLKEPGFSIAPDPEYLFLSGQHREALAHLLYGAGESGGFVLLTGEVGTGKTTVCRALLDQLPGEVDVALVLNPAVSELELLRTICEEFHVPVRDDEDSAKRLIDRLNRYLLEAHARGRRPVLLIDEAQALRPSVLELVRLLTNLETTKHKLLQIFLVGQPELRDLIDSPQLRQLSQRITARYHLGPLKADETAAYIRHRLAVAGVDRPLFTRGAVRRIHVFSEGVPRLINILCDRALLGACVRRDLQVRARTVARAARELRGDQPRPLQRQARPAFVVALLAAVAIGAGVLTQGWIAGGGDRELRRWVVSQLGGELAAEPVPAQVAPQSAPRTAAEGSSEVALASGAAASPEVEDRARQAVGSRAAGSASGGSDSAVTDGELAVGATPTAAAERPATPREPVSNVRPLRLADALAVLLRSWGVATEALDAAGDPCRRVADFGLRCEFEQGTWGNLRFFDRPVLLELPALDGDGGFVALTRLGEEVATLTLPDGAVQVDLADLGEHWSGAYLLVWQPPPVGTALIGPGSSGEAVAWLRQLLAQVPDLGFTALEGRAFDEAIATALRRFQRGRGLAVDGLAGYRTLIQLHNAVAMPAIPKLVEVP